MNTLPKVNDESNMQFSPSPSPPPAPLQANGNGHPHHHHDAHINKYDEDDSFFGLWVGENKSADLITNPLALLLKQFATLINKRFIHSIRNKSLIISQLIIPLAVLLINLIYSKYGPLQPVDSPPLVLDLQRYAPNLVPYTAAPSAQAAASTQLAHYFADHINSGSHNTYAFDLHEAWPPGASKRFSRMCRNATQSVRSYLICLGRLSINYVTDDFVLACEFTDNDASAWSRSLMSENSFDSNDESEGESEESPKRISIVAHFNNQPFHVTPLAVNLVSNAVWRYLTVASHDRDNSTESSSPPSLSLPHIKTSNYPLPRNLKEQVTDFLFKDATGFNIAGGLSFGFSFLVASFVVFLIKERSSDAKHLQYMSCCNSSIFWLSAFVWDMCNYVVPCFFVLLSLKVFDINEFVGDHRWLYVSMILVCYGLAHIPQVYLLSYIFKASATGFASIVGWNILSSRQKHNKKKSKQITATSLYRISIFCKA